MGEFSGSDFSRYFDSQAIYRLSGLKGPLRCRPPSPRTANTPAIRTGTIQRSRRCSQICMVPPPTLFVTSTRDLLLSNTAILHRAFIEAGVDAELVAFEALPHAFWNDATLPESKEASHIMAAFFDKHLGG
jgi:epsilon-lactone hydrolase